MKLKIKATRGLLILRQELFPLMKCLFLYGLYTCLGFRKYDDRSFVDLISKILGSETLLASDKDFFVEILKKKQFSRWELLSSFFRLPEKIFPILKKFPVNDAHHAARLIMVQHLPKAARILDLGGASDHAQEGALLSMGYAHQPESICIVDQPYELREHYDPQIKAPEHLRYKGTEVSYIYTLMSDLKKIPSASFDMIWCGQSIEHIFPQEAETLFAEARRILVPGGYFCLDTPNSLLARLASPYALLHPEHKIEYRPSQLIEAIEGAGLKIRKVLAVSPMPISLRMKRFCRLEIVEHIAVQEDYDSGYSFYIEAQVGN